MDNEVGSAVRRLVLVVDDDAAVSATLERSLKRLGYEVLVAIDGADGFEQALRAQPAVVLSDVRMPGMDGHALLRRLTRSGLQASVILMSAQGDVDDAIGALREGAVDYLKKPWTMLELTTVMDRAMGLFSALRELSFPPDIARSTARARSVGGEVVDASALIDKLAGRAARGELTLPAVSPAIAALRDSAGAGDAQQSARIVDDFIEKDPGLATAVLRTDSEIQEPERLPDDVRALVATMGREAIHDAATTLALRDAFPIGVAPLRILNDRIWRFSVSRALAMRGIADLAEVEAPVDKHQYYLAGLMLDVGASYLLSSIAAAMERLGGGISDAATMTAAIAIHHGPVGSFVLRRWQFSSEWEALVRDHHGGPPAAPTPLWCATALGSAVAVRLAGFGDPTGDRDLAPETLARCAYTLGVGDTALRRLTKSLTESANQIWAACA